MQGPALYVFNNATFTEEDWRGIKSPRVGSKKDCPDKVGKFGMGFSSVYHVTGDPISHTFDPVQKSGLHISIPDCPWILSNHRIRIMDFQHLHLTKDVRNWNLESEGDRVKWRNCPDQMEPWKVSSSFRKSHIF